MTDSDPPTPHTIDTRGLLCPLPVLRARKALKALKAGDVLVMHATDPVAAIDVPHFCSEAGHTLLTERRDGEILIFEIKKGRD